MRLASSTILPRNLEDFLCILFGQSEPFLRENRPDVVHVGRHQVDDLRGVEGRHHGDLHEFLRDRQHFLRGHASEEGRVGKGILLLRVQLAPGGLFLLQDDLQLREGHERLFHTLSLWTLESMTIVTRAPTSNVWNDRVMGESPRWRGPRRNFCRVFSMIPFEAFTIVRPLSSWTSSR